jgi:hypothetical protein
MYKIANIVSTIFDMDVTRRAAKVRPRVGPVCSAGRLLPGSSSDLPADAEYGRDHSSPVVYLDGLLEAHNESKHSAHRQIAHPRTAAPGRRR